MQRKAIELRYVVFLLLSITLFFGCAGRETTAQPIPVIQYQYTGGPSPEGRMAFLISIFEDGTVTFDGKHRTKVIGEAHLQVGTQKVQEWVKALVEAGVMNKRESPGFHPIPDRDWWRLTVRHDGVTNSYRYLTHPLVQVQDKILGELNVVSRWIR